MDYVLEEMANELYQALVSRGIDPANPPTDSTPPSVPAFNEYVRRGGQQFDDSDKFAQALVERVKEAGRV